MIDYLRLEGAALKLHEKFRTAAPFPHIVIDGLFEEDVARRVAEAFPPLNPSSRIDSYRSHRHYHSKKYSIQEPTRFPPVIREAIEGLQSPRFLACLERVTGITGLLADPQLVGAGMHVTGRGGFLDVHADFNVHPVAKHQRILNLLVYFNLDWQASWRGELEFWSADMRSSVQRVAPLFNRALLFEVSDISFHGYPDPLRCPEDRQRNSLQLYYYREWPASTEPRQLYTTDYRPRPRDYAKRFRHALTRAIGPRGRGFLRRLVGR